MPFALDARTLVASAFALVLPGVLCLAQSPVVVRSTAPPVWGSSPRLVEEMRIGVLDGDEEYMLGLVYNVAVGRNGTVIIEDHQLPLLRMYDASGKFVRNIGRAGEGPGEYRSIAGVETFPDGRIVVWDNRIQRLTVYSPDGRYVSSMRVPSGLWTQKVFQVDRAGYAYVLTVTEIPKPDEQWTYGWIRVSPAGKILDTIAVPREPNPADSWVFDKPSGYERPFTRELVTTMSSVGALIVGQNDRYAFELRRPGSTAVRIEREYIPVPLKPDEKKEWDAWATYMQDRSASPLLSDRIVPGAIRRRRQYNIPAVKPAFSEFRTDSDGRIWVRRYVDAVRKPEAERKPGDPRPRRVWKEQPTYDVFESTGRFMGTVVLPWNADFEDAIGTAVYLTLTGESGEEVIARMRIIPQR
jgi:hypothetical protein